jgi:hypothetical protein
VARTTDCVGIPSVGVATAEWREALAELGDEALSDWHPAAMPSRGGSVLMTPPIHCTLRTLGHPGWARGGGMA